MDNDLFQKLKLLANSNKIVSIFSNRNCPDTWSSGFIESISKKHIVLKHISPDGRYDGFIARRLDNIYRIDFDGIYEQRLLKLYSIQKQLHNNIFMDNKFIGDNLFKKLLQAAKKSNYVVSICIDESEQQENIIGFVKKINDDIVVISKVSYEGLDDGESTFYLDDIVLINCDTSDEIPYKLLFTDK